MTLSQPAYSDLGKLVTAMHRECIVVLVAGVLASTLGRAPREVRGDGPPEDAWIKTEAVRQLLSSDEARRAGAVERIRNEYAGGADRVRGLIERDLIVVISTLSNQTRRSEALSSAMALAGELRVEGAVKYLVAFIASPYQSARVQPPIEFEYFAAEPGSALGRCWPHDTELARTPILLACPAVPALIQIGKPAIDPVARELVSARNVCRMRCCLKVLKDLEKDHPEARAAIAKAVDKAWSESDAKRIARYARRLDENPEIALFADEWDR